MAVVHSINNVPTKNIQHHIAVRFGNDIRARQRNNKTYHTIPEQEQWQWQWQEEQERTQNTIEPFGVELKWRFELYIYMGIGTFDPLILTQPAILDRSAFAIALVSVVLSSRL